MDQQVLSWLSEKESWEPCSTTAMPSLTWFLSTLLSTWWSQLHGLLELFLRMTSKSIIVHQEPSIAWLGETLRELPSPFCFDIHRLRFFDILEDHLRTHVLLMILLLSFNTSFLHISSMHSVVSREERRCRSPSLIHKVYDFNPFPSLCLFAGKIADVTFMCHFFSCSLVTNPCFRCTEWWGS